MKIKTKDGQLVDIDFNSIISNLTDDIGNVPTTLILEDISWSNLDFGSHDQVIEIKVRAKSPIPDLSPEASRKKFYDK